MKHNYNTTFVTAQCFYSAFQVYKSAVQYYGAANVQKHCVYSAGHVTWLQPDQFHSF